MNWLALLATALSLSLTPECRALPQSDVWEVYILTGQSNALGTTVFEGTRPETFGPGTHPADADTNLFWSNVTPANINYPPNVLYGDSGDAIVTLQTQQGDGNGNSVFWGPEFGFARALHDARGARRTLIIKATRAGGGNTLWDRNRFVVSPNGGHMWGHLRDTVDRALGLLAGNHDRFVVRALLFLQGESNDTVEANAARARLGNLRQDLRAHIHALYPGTATEMKTIVAEIAASNSTTSHRTTMLGHMDLAATELDVGFIRTADLPLKPDNIHFGRDAKLTIGARFAAALLDRAEPFRIAGYDASAGDAATLGEVQRPTEQHMIELWAAANTTLQGVIDGVTPAWRVFDNSLSFNPSYHRSLTRLDYAQMFHRDWSFRASAKVVSGGGLALWSVESVNDPGWGVASGVGNMNGFVLSRVNGSEFEVQLWQQPGSVVNLGQGSANTFHELELRGSRGSPRFDFLIDDVLQLADVDLTTSAGLSGFHSRLVFTSGSTAAIGRDVLWAQVDLSAAPFPVARPCGLALPFGSGCASTGGLVPTLATAGCVTQNSSFSLSLTQAPADATAAVAFGLAPGLLTFGACDLLVTPIITIAALPVAPDGTGSMSLDVGPDNEAFHLSTQVLVLDPSAPFGVITSNAVELVVL